MIHDRFTVEGSHGSVDVDGEGNVLNAYNDAYPDIVRFDVKEFAEFYGHPPTTEGRVTDILDIGYWTRDGHYEPPVGEWRAEIKTGQALKG